MSIQTLKLELGGRSGRELLPHSFPIDLLIAMTRELALVADRSLSYDELCHMTVMINDYLRRVVEMHGKDRLNDFEGRLGEMVTPLVQELYDCMCEELVSRLIGYDVRSTSLGDRFLAVLDAAEESL